MPLITVTYSSVRKAPTLKAEIASAVSDLTARILHKDPRVTAVIVEAVNAADWFAGGRSLSEQSLRQFLARRPCQRRHQHQGREGRLSRGNIRADGRTARGLAP